MYRAPRPSDIIGALLVQLYATGVTWYKKKLKYIFPGTWRTQPERESEGRRGKEWYHFQPEWRCRSCSLAGRPLVCGHMVVSFVQSLNYKARVIECPFATIRVPSDGPSCPALRLSQNPSGAIFLESRTSTLREASATIGSWREATAPPEAILLSCRRPTRSMPNQMHVILSRLRGRKLNHLLQASSHLCLGA